MAELDTAMKALIENDIDMILCEYFRNIEEMEWAIELVRSYNKPCGATMCVGPNGDVDGVSLGIGEVFLDFEASAGTTFFFDIKVTHK